MASVAVWDAVKHALPAEHPFLQDRSKIDPDSLLKLAGHLLWLLDQIKNDPDGQQAKTEEALDQMVGLLRETVILGDIPGLFVNITLSAIRHGTLNGEHRTNELIKLQQSVRNMIGYLIAKTDNLTEVHGLATWDAVRDLAEPLPVKTYRWSARSQREQRFVEAGQLEATTVNGAIAQLETKFHSREYPSQIAVTLDWSNTLGLPASCVSNIGMNNEFAAKPHLPS